MISAVHGIGADGEREIYYPSLSRYFVFAYDPQGNLIWRDDSTNITSLANGITVYDAYGNLLLDQTPDNALPSHFDSIGFAGQYGTFTDAEIGRGASGIASPVLMIHRYYDSRTGRFINRDPIGYSGGVNLYGYAGNNPVNAIDPEGTSLLSFAAKQGGKRLTKGLIKNFIETQIKQKIKKVGIKKFSEQYSKEASDAYNQIDSILSDQWWEIGIGFIPIAGDAFDLVDQSLKFKKAFATLDNLQAKIQKTLEIQGKTSRALISPASRRSSSWAEELADKTFKEIVEMSSQPGEIGHKASQMKKLILEESRLGSKRHPD